ncbi:hypothetical protein [Actibacterium lipolyticum]|uniref:Uncharacterized protein n=1 Tax=Actibacterium lipolyticum TaxID=1524263 RepID=A0A238KNI0_9RHOB|nr:hypothetical protein [Actibacterium lipolyticum]SMX43722.1 hypothetical protein COL8621_02369 [Actibacterium lipolyticum]
MNFPTIIALAAVAAALVVPLVFHLRKRALGRVKVRFAVDLPQDPLTKARTAHATHGAMPAMLQLDYDWWCAVMVEAPDGVTLSTIARLPLAQGD